MRCRFARTDHERVMKWIFMTGKSRASYHRVLADLRAMEEAAGLTQEQPKKLPRRTRPAIPLVRSHK